MFIVRSTGLEGVRPLGEVFKSSCGVMLMPKQTQMLNNKNEMGQTSELSRSFVRALHEDGVFMIRRVSIVLYIRFCRTGFRRYAALFLFCLWATESNGQSMLCSSLGFSSLRHLLSLRIARWAGDNMILWKYVEIVMERVYQVDERDLFLLLTVLRNRTDLARSFRGPRKNSYNSSRATFAMLVWCFVWRHSRFIVVRCLLCSSLFCLDPNTKP